MTLKLTLEERIARFKEQIKEPVGNLNLLTLIDEVVGMDACVSCGAKLKGEESTRCNLCADALWMALFNDKRPRGAVHRPTMSINDLEHYDD